MAEEPKVRYGGQAVIEGVMIRGRKSVVTSVRRPNGELTIDVKPVNEAWTKRYRRIPFLRGIVILIETMVMGIKSLLYSANIAVEEEAEEIPSKAIWAMIASAAVLVVVLFFLAPLFLTRLVDQYIPNTIVFHIVEGVIRLAIFLAYLKAMSLMPDIKRVFTYHGAEHKTVNALQHRPRTLRDQLPVYGAINRYNRFFFSGTGNPLADDSIPHRSYPGYHGVGLRGHLFRRQAYG